MDKRISVVSIILESQESSTQVNAILREYRDWVVARMGIPYRERGVSIISVVLDAPPDVTSALSGKLGMLKSVTSKTVTTKV